MNNTKLNLYCKESDKREGYDNIHCTTLLNPGYQYDEVIVNPDCFGFFKEQGYGEIDEFLNKLRDLCSPSGIIKIFEYDAQVIANDFAYNRIDLHKFREFVQSPTLFTCKSMKDLLEHTGFTVKTASYLISTNWKFLIEVTPE
jgi:hypothetical protein